MFSNLRVETEKTNHYFIPSEWRIFSLGQNLVEITSSSSPALQKYADEKLLINEAEIRRIAQKENGYFTVSIRRGNETIDISSINTPDHQLLRPLNPTFAKVFRFRPVDPQHKPNRSQH